MYLRRRITALERQRRHPRPTPTIAIFDPETGEVVERRGEGPIVAYLPKKDPLPETSEDA
jgi:hypothetical protein